MNKSSKLRVIIWSVLCTCFFFGSLLNGEPVQTLSRSESVIFIFGLPIMSMVFTWMFLNQAEVLFRKNTVVNSIVTSMFGSTHQTVVLIALAIACSAAGNVLRSAIMARQADVLALSELGACVGALTVVMTRGNRAE